MNIPQNQSVPVLASPGHAVKVGFKQFKGKFKEAAVLALPVLGTVIILRILLYRLVFSTFEQDSLKGSQGLLNLLSIGWQWQLALLILSGIIYSVLAVFFGISLVRLFGSDEHSTFKQHFAMARYSFWPYIWVSILSGLIAVGGIVLLIVPGLLFWVWFSMAPYATVMEDRWGMEALMRSKQLVSGRFWRVVGRLLLVMLAVIASTIPLLIISASLKDGFLAYDISSQIYTFLVVAPFSIACLTALFKDLRDTAPAFSYERREGIKFILLGLLGIAIVPILLIGALLKFLLPYADLLKGGLSPNDNSIWQNLDGGYPYPQDIMDIDLQNSY